MVKSLGADKVIDYTKEDFTKSGQTYDAIFDTVIKTSFSRCKSSLKQRRVYLTLDWPLLQDSRFDQPFRVLVSEQLLHRGIELTDERSYVVHQTQADSNSDFPPLASWKVR